MTTTFPENKSDFTAENGVTYTWDVNRWRTKAYKLDDSNYVTNDEFSEGQGGQDDRIDELESKVNGLEGSLVDAVWTFEEDDRIPRNGEFALRTGIDAVTADFEQATVIVLSTVDANGNNWTFEKVTINDVIRLGAADGSGAEYKITQVIAPGTYGIDHLRSTPDAADEVPYAFIFLSQFDPAGLATVDYVDRQDALYLPLAGGSMEGQLHLPIEPEWEDSATSKSYVDNLAATNLALVWAQNYATEEYVDNAIGDLDPGEGGGEGNVNLDELDERYLQLTGGVVDGQTTIKRNNAGVDNAYVFNVEGSRMPEGQTSAFRVTADGAVKAGHDVNRPFIAQANNDVVTKAYSDIEFSLSMKRFGNNDVATGEEDEERIFRIRGIKDDENRFTCVSINNESMGLYNVRPPEEGHHAANRDYVDEQIEDAPFLPLTGGTLSDRLFFERRSGMNMIISPNSSDTSTSVYACNGGAIRFRSLPGTDVNNSTTHFALGKQEDGDPATYIYHLQDPEEPLWAANKQYVDSEIAAAINGIGSGGGSESSERLYTIHRSNTPVANGVTFYEASGFFYYFIDVRPASGRIIGAPANFGFKDTLLPFKIGWIQSNGAENIMVSGIAVLTRKTTEGPNHYFQVAVDPTRDDTLIHDPYTVPQGSTVTVTLSGLI